MQAEPALVWVSHIDFPRPDDITFFPSGGNVHLLLRVGNDATYFRIPRLQQPDGAVSAQGILMVNLTSGSIGIIHSVGMLPGCPSEIVYRRLAPGLIRPAAEVIAFAMADVQHVRGAGGFALAEDVTDVLADLHVAQTEDDAVVPTTPTGRPKRGHSPAKASHFISRLRDKEDADLRKITDMAETLKPRRMGDDVAPHTKAPAPLTALELKTLAHVCQLEPLEVATVEAAAGLETPAYDDYFYSGDDGLRLSHLTSVKQKHDKHVTSYIRRFRETKIVVIILLSLKGILLN
jgi:hypothetical protein